MYLLCQPECLCSIPQHPNKSWAWLCVSITSPLNGRDESHIISALGSKERWLPNNINIGWQRDGFHIISALGGRDESQKSGWPIASFSSGETLSQGGKVDSNRRHSRSCSGFYMRLKATHLYTTRLMPACHSQKEIQRLSTYWRHLFPL